MYSVRALPQHESTRDWISEGQADLLGTVDVSDWNGRPHSLVAGWARKGGAPAPSTGSSSDPLAVGHDAHYGTNATSRVGLLVPG